MNNCIVNFIICNNINYLKQKKCSILILKSKKKEKIFNKKILKY